MFFNITKTIADEGDFTSANLSPIIVSVAKNGSRQFDSEYSEIFLEGLPRSAVNRWQATGRKIDVDIDVPGLVCSDKESSEDNISVPSTAIKSAPVSVSVPLPLRLAHYTPDDYPDL